MDRCIVVGLAVLPFAVWHVAVEYYFLLHPTVATFVDRAFIQRTLLLQAIVWIGGWLAVIAVGLLIRRRSPSNALLVTVTVQLYCIAAPLLSYCLGLYTSNYTGAVGLAGAVVGFMFFGNRQIFAGIASFILLLVGTTVGEQLGLIPYAPLMAVAPFSNGRLATSWLLGPGMLTTVIEVFGICLIYYIIAEWRDREQALAHAHQQLTHASDIISRYVASQLAERILAGNYEGLNRHDRRKLTLFFSDIKDFAETADHVEPEDLSEVLNDYLSEMALIAERHGGTIDKFVGDAVMVFFGAPNSTTDHDHALRAVRMAVEMQERMAALRHKWLRNGFERPFQVRIGINTGQASIGNFGSKGRMDYTAIGRQVNLAARLQAQCEPGKVLITHSTWVLVQDHVECIPKGEIQVKGFQNPVTVYEVRGLKASPQD